MRRYLVLDVVGLTPRLLHSGHMPRLEAYASAHSLRRLRPDLPAVTCTGQASILTGAAPARHGAVANGWYFRDLAEVWMWRQSSRLLEGPTVFERFHRAHPGVPTAQLFWWWNLPSRARISVTPRPTYYADGHKDGDIHAHPPELRRRLRDALGEFPLRRFWGPGAGLASTRWIADAALQVLKQDRPGLTLVYLPHLDYDLQRFGPDSARAARAAREADCEAGRLLDHAAAEGIQAVVVSEYGITAVSRAVFPNRLLRREGLLAVHPARNGALLDPGHCRAFCVCDHQVAHVYVADPADLPEVRRLLENLQGVGQVLDRPAQEAMGIGHARCGELVLVAEADKWFAYPYWDGSDRPPDFARTVDIHRKPGYDPCELFLDPQIAFVRGRIAWRLLKKRLGFRVLFDFIPLATGLVRGSHGRIPEDPGDGPVWLGPEELAPAGDPAPIRAALAAIPS